MTKEIHLTPTQAAHMLAHELGEMPPTWQKRLQNWRVPGREGSLKHHHEPGRRPYYRASEVRAFIGTLKKTRTVIAPKDSATAQVLKSEDGVVLKWASSCASGQIYLTLDKAVELGVQITKISSSP